MFYSRTLRWQSALVVCGLVCICGVAAAGEDPPVSGLYKTNGKEAKLAFVKALKGDADRKDRTILIFTEKDPAKFENPELKAMFGELGSALIITIKPDGKISGCHIAHSAASKGGFSSIGEVELTNFQKSNGRLQGKLSSGGEQKAFGDTWEVKLTFNTKAP